MIAALRARSGSRAVLIGLIAAAICLLTGGLKATPYNNYVLLADAFLHGHAWIDWPGEWIDALPYAGRHYIIEGPLPALLLMPFVKIFGTQTSQTAFGVGVCGICVALWWQLTARMRIALSSRCWLTLFFFAGTDLWWCASLGYVWFIAHLTAVAATLAALLELSGKRRPALVALYAVCAAESRFTLVLALPVYAAMLVMQTSWLPLKESGVPTALKIRARRVLPPYIAVITAATIAWIAYNEVRWGLPYDIGYTAWYHLDGLGSPTGSPFALRYFAYEWAAFFTALPGFTPAYPWLISPIAGIGLPVTSPALIIAAGARRTTTLIVAMWILAITVAVPSFLYYVDGGAQFGMRHALDFEPYLLVLMACAMRRGTRWWQAVLCAYSALVGAWGTWYWQAVVHG